MSSWDPANNPKDAELLRRQLEWDAKARALEAKWRAEPAYEISERVDLTPTAKFLVATGGEMPLGGWHYQIRIIPQPGHPEYRIPNGGLF